MSTAGYGMKFSPGYLGGKREPEAKGKPEAMPHEEGSHVDDIHEHLRSMHEKTGHAHSHVEHHGDGSHTSHHIHEDGNIEGPHEHPDTQSMSAKMEEMGEPEGMSEDSEGE